MRRAASCSALRRDRPSPCSARPSAGTAHSTSKVCACAWPRVASDAVRRHRQTPRLQPFLQFGLGVLAPAVGVGAGDQLAEQAAHQRRGRHRSRRRGRPRRSAPPAHRPGSTAAARRRRAASPSDRRSTSGRPSTRAARCRLSSRTRWARTRVRSPSSEPAKRSYSRRRHGQVSTASPRNSSRSLWSAPKLRWVSARCSSEASAKRWPRRCCRASRRDRVGPGQRAVPADGPAERPGT